MKASSWRRRRRDWSTVRAMMRLWSDLVLADCQHCGTRPSRSWKTDAALARHPVILRRPRSQRCRQLLQLQQPRPGISRPWETCVTPYSVFLWRRRSSEVNGRTNVPAKRENSVRLVDRQDLRVEMVVGWKGPGIFSWDF